jgi:hypothetical protein
MPDEAPGQLIGFEQEPMKAFGRNLIALPTSQ